MESIPIKNSTFKSMYSLNCQNCQSEKFITSHLCVPMYPVHRCKPAVPVEIGEVGDVVCRNQKMVPRDGGG